MLAPKAAPTAEMTPEEFATSLEADYAKAKKAPGPKVLTPDEFAAGIADVYPKQPSKLRALAGSALEGLATVPEAGAIAARKLGEATGMSQETPFFSDWAGGLRGAAALVDPVESRGRGGVAEDVVRAVGSMAGAAPAMALGPIAAGIQFGAQSGVPLYYQIKAKTNDEEAATLGLIFGIGVGQLEKFGAERAATSFVRKLLGKGLGEAIEGLAMRTAVGFVKGAAAETGTEALQTALEDKIYESLSGDDIDNWESIKRSIPPSLLLGGFGGGLDAAIARSAARHEGTTQEPSAAPEAPTAPTLPQEPGAATVAPQPTPGAEPAQSPSQVAPSATPTAPVEPSTAPEAASAASTESVAQEPASVEATPEVPPTGIKNATVAKELAQINESPALKDAPHKDQELLASAVEKSKAEPRSGENLVRDLEAAPRPPSDAESALLTVEANRLRNERVAAEDALLKDPSPANQARVDEAKANYKRAADVFDRVGTESGRTLRARRLMIEHDYSLAEMERSYEIAKGGEPLTAEESARVKKYHEEIAALTKEHADLTSAVEAKKAEQAAQEAMGRMQKAAKSSGRRAKRANQIAQARAELDATLNELGAHVGSKAGAGLGALDAKTLALTAKAAAKSIEIGVKSLAQFADSMVARFGEDIRPYVAAAWEQAHGEKRKEMAAPLAGKELKDIHRTVSKIAESFVESGVSDVDELTDKVHEVLKETHPDITRSEARDALSGYGQFRELSKGEVKAKLRDLQGQARQLGKLEDLQAKQAPKRSGVEHREPSAAEKRLAKKVRDLAQKLGLSASSDAVRQKAMKTRIANRIAELEARIAAKDFGPRSKPQPINTDEETVAAKAKLETVKRQFERGKESQRLAQRSVLQKGLDGAKEVLDLSVAIRSAFDFSAVRRQGGFFTSGHPLRARKHMAEMFRAWANPEVAARVDAAIHARPNASRAKAAGLQMTSVDGELLPGEEAIHSKLSDRIPGLKASNRAYVTYLNLQRATAFDAMVESLPTAPTPAEMQDIANFVNVATGRASGKKAQGIARALGSIKFFWAPSFLVSRFQLALSPLKLAAPGKMTRQVRGAIGKELLRAAAGQAAYYALLGIGAAATADALDEEFSIETDPRSSDFGKVKIGNTRIDPLGGLGQVATFLSREITGKTKAAKSGDVRTLEKKRPTDSTRADVALRFVRSKAGPIPGTIWNLLEGKTYVGEEPSLATEAPAPLAIADTYRVMRELGIPAGTAIGALALLGDGVQTYDADAKKGKK